MAAKVICVGDQRQQIYVWRGASDSFKLFQSRNNVKTLPMNISQRCAVEICKNANMIFPENPIQHKDSAKTGSVQNCDNDYLLKNVKPHDFVLCRTNAPLVDMAYKLIRNKIAAKVLGRDIGWNLIQILDAAVKENNTDDVSILIKAIQGNTVEQVKKLEELEKPMQAESLQDRTECLLVFFENAKTIEEVKENIKEVFTDDANEDSVILSTVHKIKGAESNTVYIIRPEILKHPRGKAFEEKCIAFVAITRAKENLYYVVEKKEDVE